MDDAAERLAAAMEDILAVAEEVTVDDALGSFDTVALQNFWRDWPRMSQWAGALWRALNADLGEAADGDAPIDTGGSG